MYANNELTIYHVNVFELYDKVQAQRATMNNNNKNMTWAYDFTIKWKTYILLPKFSANLVNASAAADITMIFKAIF